MLVDDVKVRIPVLMCKSHLVRWCHWWSRTSEARAFLDCLLQCLWIYNFSQSKKFKEKKSTRLDLQGLENRILTFCVGCLNSDTISDLNELTGYVLIARISFPSCLLKSQKVKPIFFFGSENKLRAARSSLSLWECSPLPGAENLVAHPLTVRKAGRQRRWNFKRWKRMKMRRRRWRKELFVFCNCTSSTDNGLQRPFILHLWTAATVDW